MDQVFSVDLDEGMSTKPPLLQAEREKERENEREIERESLYLSLILKIHVVV